MKTQLVKSQIVVSWRGWLRWLKHLVGDIGESVVLPSTELHCIQRVLPDEPRLSMWRVENPVTQQSSWDKSKILAYRLSNQTS
jgi:hypothetical protein